MLKTDGEIEADMQRVINDQWPPAMREKALRTGGVMLDSLNAFFADMSVLKAQKIAERDAAKIAYEAEQAAIPEVPVEEVLV